MCKQFRKTCKHTEGNNSLKSTLTHRNMCMQQNEMYYSLLKKLIQQDSSCPSFQS